MPWSETVITCERVQNSMDTTGITKSRFENFYGYKYKNIDSFLEFGYIAYVKKMENINKQMTDMMYKASMVGQADNHTRDIYKL